jgi:murein lipoprotein
MSKSMIRTAATAMLGGLLLAGCATNSDLMEVRQIAEQAQADASSAQATANEARTIAQQAMQMSQATDERVNRMFQRSMMK